MHILQKQRRKENSLKLKNLGIAHINLVIVLYNWQIVFGIWLSQN